MKIRNHLAVAAHFKNNAGPMEDKSKDDEFVYKEYLCSSCKQVILSDDLNCSHCLNNKQSL